MKIYRVYSSTVILCCFLTGCFSDTFFGRPDYEKQLNGNYYLLAFDEDKEMSIGIQIGEEGVGVIEATIFAVGQNEDFIIAKQHPLSAPGVINKKITNYFIIPLNFKVSKSADKNYLGPLSSEQFEQRRKEFKITSLQFSIRFKEME